MSAGCLTYKTVARLLGSLLRELSVGLREFFAKKHLADKHNFDLINGRLRRRRIFTVSTVILSGRTQFAPNDVQFPLRFCLRDAEDVVPYDRIAVDSLYIQQNFDLNSYRTIPPSRLTPCHLPLHKGGEGKIWQDLFVYPFSPSVFCFAKSTSLVRGRLKSLSALWF